MASKVSKIFLTLAFILSFSTATQAAYIYAYQVGEYSVTLPGPPHGETIWSHDPHIPLLDQRERSARIGEIVNFDRSSIQTGDKLKVKITTVMAELDYLQSLNETNLTSLIETEARSAHFAQKEIFYSESSKDAMRRAVKLTGITETKEGVPTYNHFQLMTGHNTITLVQIVYSSENKDFKKDANDIIASIKFIGN